MADGTIQTYNACTYPSSLTKYPTIPEGEYEAEVGKHQGKYEALKMRDVGAKNQTIELGCANPAHPDVTYISGANIHLAGKNNYTGMFGKDKSRAVSEACILIDINQWESFMSNFLGNSAASKVGIYVSRTPATIYPAYNFINNGYFSTTPVHAKIF